MKFESLRAFLLPVFGVIKVLESHGITPDIVVGSSAGSFVGALYASGMTGLQLQEAAMRLEEAPFFDWRFNERGLLTGKTRKG